MLLFAVLFVLASVSESKRLNDHVHHYEVLHYDADALMHEHYRMMRHSNDKYPAHIKLAFTTHGRHFDLRLVPDDSMHSHKDYELIVDGKPHSRSEIRSLSYIGHDVNDPVTKVYGNLAFGVFDGAIHTRDEIYHIEPAQRYFEKHSMESHSIAYLHSSVHLKSSQSFSSQRQSSCGATDDAKRRFLARISAGSPLHLHKRQITRNPNKVSCWINVVADHLFYDAVTTMTAGQATRVAEASALLQNIVASTNAIYKRVDFNSDNSPDGINFAIQKLTINTSAPSDTFFSNEFLGVESLLDKFSENDWSDFCLSYIFTSRDFDNGVLGLAFVGDPIQRGGICDDLSNRKTLNTGVVTMVNYGNRVSNAAAMLTFAHETGHNFGSDHDSESCSPPDNSFIMTAFANDGTQSNNRNFSLCSIASMNTIIGLKGQNQDGCFRESTDTCGNNLLDEGEDCDCGVEYNGNTGLCDNDPCCNATACRITNAIGVVCSPQSSGCCFSNCSIIPEWANHICLEETECAQSQSCNGTSAECFQPLAKESNDSSSISCNSGSNYCVGSQCTGSICVPLELPDCECTEADFACHVCCRLPNGTCSSTIGLAQENSTARNLLPNKEGKVYIVGFPCYNYTGYCDFYDRCRPVKEEGALTFITDFLSGNQSILTVFNWVAQYWWAAVVAAVVILVALFLIVLGCHCILPRPEHMKKRNKRRQKLKREQRQSSRRQHSVHATLWETTHNTKF